MDGPHRPSPSYNRRGTTGRERGPTSTVTAVSPFPFYTPSLRSTTVVPMVLDRDLSSPPLSTVMSVLTERFGGRETSVGTR